MSNQKKKDYFFQLISVFAAALKFIDFEATKIHRNRDNIVIKLSIKKSYARSFVPKNGTQFSSIEPAKSRKNIIKEGL